LCLPTSAMIGVVDWWLFIRYGQVGRRHWKVLSFSRHVLLNGRRMCRNAVLQRWCLSIFLVAYIRHSRY
jgi:hypothetical protein